MDDKDKAQANLDKLGIRTGGRYRHFKGGEYEVIALAVKEDTLEPMVIYRSLLKGSIWARTVDNWQAEVDSEGQIVQRFTRVFAS